jgi:putative Ca2+/H+ antiporter (TMEM165/GDT1 family)
MRCRSWTGRGLRVLQGRTAAWSPFVLMHSFLLSPFLLSTGVVALAEMGDKTQLLALVLAAKFRKPWAIATGILIATLANHAVAAWAGAAVAGLVEGFWFQFALAASFVGLGLWSLVPDRLDENGGPPQRLGAFLTTLIAFFVVEIGDKTQIATVGLAIRFDSLPAVVLGTTLGMMLANAPVVVFGDALAERLPLRLVRRCAAVAFALLGVSVLAGWP